MLLTTINGSMQFAQNKYTYALRGGNLKAAEIVEMPEAPQVHLIVTGNFSSYYMTFFHNCVDLPPLYGQGAM